MLYVADITVTDSDLVGRMTLMRAWLDHQRLEPTSFRLRRVGDRQIVRVYFNEEREAAAFAEEFGGSSAPPSVTAEAIAGPL